MGTSRRPLIGITCYVEQARWGAWDLPAALLPYAYVRHVEQAGGVALVLPPNATHAAEAVAAIDGLLVAGGADLDPRLYDEPPHQQTVGTRPERDAGEVAALRSAYDRDLPVLGICRGMQLMSVVAGGTLHQHLPDVVGHERHRAVVGEFGTHDVRIAAGSRLGDVLGEYASVATYHHQGVASAGTLTVSAWADDDTIEAVEDPQRRFAVGVLWHPEMRDDLRLFEALVSAAAIR